MTQPKAATLPPPPTIDPDAPMVSRMDRIVIDRPPMALSNWMLSSKIEDQLPPTRSLPGVAGTRALTPGLWGEAGERRELHLTDGGRATEQVLEFVSGKRFRYQVWGYTTAAAQPIAYAIGEFRYAPLDRGRTELLWTYSFLLKPDRFPGNLGAFGRWLFRVAFIDRAYAELMRVTLKAMKAQAELAAPRFSPDASEPAAKPKAGPPRRKGSAARPATRPRPGG